MIRLSITTVPCLRKYGETDGHQKVLGKGWSTNHLENVYLDEYHQSNSLIVYANYSIIQSFIYMLQCRTDHSKSQHVSTSRCHINPVGPAQHSSAHQNDSSGSGFQWLTNQQNVRYLPLPPKKKHKKNNM